MLQFQSRLDDPDDFLEAKEELFMLESFLKHAFNKNQFLDKKKKKIAQSREKNRQPLLAEEPAPPADTGELMWLVWSQNESRYIIGLHFLSFSF